MLMRSRALKTTATKACGNLEQIPVSRRREYEYRETRAPGRVAAKQSWNAGSSGDWAGPDGAPVIGEGAGPTEASSHSSRARARKAAPLGGHDTYIYSERRKAPAA
jgi:hypothetical protein